MRKRNIDVVMSLVDYEDFPQAVKIVCDSCWLYAFDIQSIDCFTRFVMFMLPLQIDKSTGDYILDDFKLRFTIPVNGKSIVSVHYGLPIVNSSSLIKCINDYIQENELKDYTVLPDILKFLYMFMPKYMTAQIVYYVAP